MFRLLLPLMLLWTTWSMAAPAPCDLRGAPAGVYLATVSPGDQVHTSFGHSSLLLWDPATGANSKFYDYGHFKLVYPDVIWDVLFADQRYFIASRRLGATQQRYAKRGQELLLQRLDLSKAEHRRVQDALIAARFAKDRSFAYNWFYPNCSTKVRDVIDDAVGGQLKVQHSRVSQTSAAAEVARHTSRNYPVWFGLLWGSGAEAYRPLSEWDAMFLPETMQHMLRTSTLTDGAASRPLVAQECVLAPLKKLRADPQPPWRDPWLALIGLAWAGPVWLLARNGRRRTSAVLVVTGLTLGVLGCLTLLIGVAGTFAPFWTHHNQVYASPLSLLLVVAAVLHWRNPRGRFAKWITASLTGIAALGTVYFAVLGFAHHNAGIAGMLLPGLAICAALTWRAGPRGVSVTSPKSTD